MNGDIDSSPEFVNNSFSPKSCDNRTPTALTLSKYSLRSSNQNNLLHGSLAHDERVNNLRSDLHANDVRLSLSCVETTV